MSIKRRLDKYKKVLYLISTFLFTWIFWIISFTSSSSHLNVIFRIVGSLMPSIVAVIFTNYFDGRRGLRELLKKLTIWKVNPFFYVFIFFYSVASFYIPSLICAIAGADYKIYIKNQIFGFNLDNPLSLLGCLLVILIFGGPLGEELGWRGFLLPTLQKKYTPLLSGIMVGVIWTCWHIPMFLFHIEGYDNFIIYLLQTISLSIIYTWIYNGVRGSLLIPILYHCIDDFIASICFPEFLNYLNMYSIIYWIIQLTVLSCIIFSITGKTSSKFQNFDFNKIG
ncbi:type II CAAX endopeptidase family protein [Clostridium sp. BL-8]|uniref:CPBP family intramembrane glutamic endopeptidase n=1 Tax=Clostridium sp. BL-8 TaxID=349938 RepID=UPI00098C34B8|nr:type II CAAX endopeptidase family protein [Clostridium sp. BL-8]OOM77592.1 CAAX amino terminal protease self- immunity [Clostridium sp. BL-8]